HAFAPPHPLTGHSPKRHGLDARIGFGYGRLCSVLFGSKCPLNAGSSGPLTRVVGCGPTHLWEGSMDEEETSYCEQVGHTVDWQDVVDDTQVGICRTCGAELFIDYVDLDEEDAWQV